MFFELDPGTRSAGEVEEGGTIPLANTAPDVNLDEILDALDTDTQAYLRLLLDQRRRQGPRRARRGPRQGCSARSGRSTGTSDALNSKVAKRKDNLRRLITNFNLLTRAVGAATRTSRDLVSSSNDRARGDRRAGPERAARDRAAAGHARAVDDRARPTSRSSPTSSARRSTTCGRSRATSTRSTPRPRSSRTRSRRPVIRTRSGRSCARRASRSRTSTKAAKRLAQGDAAADRRSATKINRLGNMAAYNPGRRRAAGHARPRRGLPLLGRLARPQRELDLPVQDAHGVLPPHLPDDRLRRGAVAARREPAGARASPASQPLFAPGAPFDGLLR